MADKELTESAWKAFAKGKGFKDTGLLKALQALDKSDKGGPEAELEALDDVDKQAGLLRKEHKADKALVAYLDKLESAAAKQRKSAETARSKAASESSEDEEDSPALLTTKLVPLLRQVPKGDVVLQVLIATTGKETAVLLSRKGISPSRGKLLKEYLGVSGAVKFIKGECLFEKNAHTFVVLTQAGGLAKKLKAALFEQTGLRIKVRVRGEDPDDIDEELEEAAEALEEAGAAGTPGAAAVTPADRAQALESAMTAWHTVRTSTIAQFKDIAREVAEARLPESSKAVIEVMAVVKQLSAEPRTLQQVRELTRWVGEDDVVAEVCEFEGDLQTPLLNALKAIEVALEA